MENAPQAYRTHRNHRGRGETDNPPADSVWYAHVITNAWLRSYDPTLVSRQRLELDLGHVWGTRRQFTLTPGVEFPLTTETLQFKSIFGFEWYF